MIIQACRKLNRNIVILLFPILFDLLAFILALSFVGFAGKGMVSIRMILEMGMPSISHLSNIPLFSSGFEFLSIAETMPLNALLVTITLVLAGAFLQGSFIGCLTAIAEDRLVAFKDLLRIGLRNWIQFILLEMIFLFGKIGITAFLAMFFGIIGVFASLVFFITLRIVFIYLEFTMVVDRVGVVGAFKKSRGYLMRSLLVTLPLVLVMYVTASLLSLALHYFWSPVTIIILTVIYAYVMTAIQLSLMTVLHETKAERYTLFSFKTAFQREKKGATAK